MITYCFVFFDLCRDYESLSHQMLRSLVDEVNILRSKQPLYHDDDDDYDNDVELSLY